MKPAFPNFCCGALILVLPVFVSLLFRTLVMRDLQGSELLNLLIGDANRYHFWALSIIQEGWLGTEVFYQAPLYPYFIAAMYWLVTPDPAVIRLAQVILTSFACLLVTLSGARFFSRPAGVVAGMLLALYPPLVWSDVLLQKGSLDVLLTSGLIFAGSELTLKRSVGWTLAFGLIAALLALNRENALLLLPILFLWLIIYGVHSPRMRLILGLSFFLSASLPLTVVAVRNYSIGREFVLTTSQAGVNFYIGNNRQATGYYRPLRPERGDPRYERHDAVLIAETAIGQKLSARQVSQFWFARAFTFIESEPRRWVGLLVKKVFLLWNDWELMDSDSYYLYLEKSPTLSLVSYALSFSLLAALAGLGMWFARRQVVSAAVLYIFPLVITLSTALFFVFARYRLSMLPALAVFAGYGIIQLRQCLKNRRFGESLRSCLIASLFLLIARLPIIHDTDKQREKALNLSLLGNAAVNYRNPARALSLYDQALEKSPGFIAALLGKIDILLHQGQIEEADSLMNQVLSHKDLPPQAFVLAAELANKQHQPELAAAYHRRAKEIDPYLPSHESRESSP